MGKAYLVKGKLHEEMVKSKIEDKLTKLSMDMFKIMVRKISDEFKGLSETDRDDIMQSAMLDIISNFRSFRHSGVYKLTLSRNFQIGENIKITINKRGCIYLVPYLVRDGKKIGYFNGRVITSYPNKNIYPFEIGKDRNKTMTNFLEASRLASSHIEVTLNKVTKIITIMDNFNMEKESLESVLEVIYPDDLALKKISDYYKEKTKEIYDYSIAPLSTSENGTFSKPSYAFNYFTSVIKNGMRKGVNELRSPVHKSGVYSLSGVNTENNGLYSI